MRPLVYEQLHLRGLKEAQAYGLVRAALVEGGHSVIEELRDEHTVTFVDSADLARRPRRVSVQAMGDGTTVFVEPDTTDASTRDQGRLGRAEARAWRRSVRPLLDEIARRARTTPGVKPPFLAALTGRRVWLAALVLLVAFALPAAVVVAVGLGWEAGWIAPGVAVPLAAALGFVLTVVLTVRFGGWFRFLSFGEEYTLSFRIFSGYALSLWRLVLQLGALVLVALATSDLEDAITTDRITNEQTASLAAHAELTPPPPGAERQSESFDQSEYDDRANATYTISYVVLDPYDVTDAESWLQGPGWADGVDGEQAFGALQEVSCEPEPVSCSADVAPADGAPVEYRVSVRVGSGYTVRRDDESLPASILRLEVEYREGGFGA